MGEKRDAMKSSRTRAATRRPDPDARDGAGVAARADRDDAPAIEGRESTAQIRDEIEETRAEMSGTIDEIQARLSPRRLMDEAKETVREAAVGKVRDVMNSASDSAGGIIDRVKENPLPAALIGIGAWWLFGGKSRTATAAQSRGGYRDVYDIGEGRSDTIGYSGAPRMNPVIDTLKQHPVPAALGGLGLAWWLMDRQTNSGAATRSVGFGYEAPGHAAGATDSMREMAHDAAETVSDLAERAQDRVGEYSERAQTEFDRLLRDNPMALGAVAVAVGAAIGMAIPESRQERQLIGGVRDQIVDKAQSLVDGAADKVQSAVSNLSSDKDQPAR